MSPAQEAMIKVLDAMKTRLLNHQGDTNSLTLLKQEIIKELKTSKFKEPWKYKWWKEHKRSEIGKYQVRRLSSTGKSFLNMYYCSTCHGHGTGRPVLQHTWHPTPIREYIAGDLPLTHILDYFEQQKPALTPQKTAMRKACPNCHADKATFIKRRSKPNWNKDRFYCTNPRGCNGKRIDIEDAVLTKMLCYENRWMPLSGALNSADHRMEKWIQKWLRHHVPIIIESAADSSDIITFIDEKKRYLSLDRADYKYACKDCAAREDLAFKNKTAYTKDRDSGHVVATLFNRLISGCEGDTKLLRDGLKENQLIKNTTGSIKKRTILRRANRK